MNRVVVRESTSGHRYVSWSQESGWWSATVLESIAMHHTTREYRVREVVEEFC
jgi:hypothetical protein